jgi:hypothetical protein
MESINLSKKDKRRRENRAPLPPIKNEGSEAKKFFVINKTTRKRGNPKPTEANRRVSLVQVVRSSVQLTS